jgi:DNA-binding PadR family transcriptional regulator
MVRTREDDSGAPSVAVVSILFALGDDELHGYGIMKEVEERTGGRVTLLPSSLYATIKRLLDTGWIEEVPTDPSPSPGRPKRTYRITEAGRLVATREAERLNALLGLARSKQIEPLEPLPDVGP